MGKREPVKANRKDPRSDATGLRLGCITVSILMGLLCNGFKRCHHGKNLVKSKRDPSVLFSTAAGEPNRKFNLEKRREKHIECLQNIQSQQTFLSLTYLGHLFLIFHTLVP